MSRIEKEFIVVNQRDFGTFYPMHVDQITVQPRHSYIFCYIPTILL